MDLRERLIAEIERREQIAQAAVDRFESTSPWVVSYGPLTGYPQRIINAAAVVIAETYEGGRLQEPVVLAPIAEYIAEHDPADALRRYTHYRSILADHATATNCEGEQVCPSCGWLGVLTRPDACDEIVALAAALNISTEGAS